jgi:Fanconi anemia group M protein
LAESISIVIDKRENRSFEGELAALGARVEWRQLELGDFLCSDKTVIERKTRADFEASIIDRRLFNQLKQLKENYPNVIVLVEGEESLERVNRNALLGAYAAIITDFGAGVFFTRNGKATTELIFAIAKHEQSGSKEISLFAKRKTFTISQTQEAVVEMLPLVGPKMAKKLLAHFGNIENIATASEEELMKIEGLGEKKAKLIRRTIEHHYGSDLEQHE